MEEQTPENQDVNFESRLDLKPLQDHVEAIKKEIGKIIVGQNDMIELLIISLLSINFKK